MRRAPGHACTPHRSTECADPGQTTCRQKPDQAWKALHGPSPELIAPLADQPGEIGFCVFTTVKRVEITLRGEPFAHLLAICGGVPKALRTIGRPWPLPAPPRPGSALVGRHS